MALLCSGTAAAAAAVALFDDHCYDGDADVEADHYLYGSFGDGDIRSSMSMTVATTTPRPWTTQAEQPYRPARLIGRPTKVDAPRIPSRDEQLARLKSGEEFDVLVVGGGCTGSGTALDAATRGLETALIERGDFGNETSSRSTKLIWAGIRYIATAFSSLLRWKNFTRPVEAAKDFKSEFDMVMNAHHERRILLENNPHLTYWVPIAIPITKVRMVMVRN